jgi:hypothetical protein
MEKQQKQEPKYKYPVGDFLSGFSEDNSNPCSYELECQRMVIRGVEYLDTNPQLFDLISKGNVNVFDKAVEPMIKYMCKGDNGQTGAMVSHSVKISYHAKKMGWDNYIKKITEVENE